MPVKPQIKTGRSITLVQLIISVIVVLSGAIGLYVKNQISMTEMNDRITAVEKIQSQYQANAAIKAQGRDAQMEKLNDKLNQNSNDINIINAKLPYFQLKK